MEPIERLLIERACERLVIAYTHLADAGQAPEVAELFTDDGVFETGGTRLAGKQAIRKVFGALQRKDPSATRHVCTNLAVTATGPDTADGVVYYTLWRFNPAPEGGELGTGQPVVSGVYRDRFARTGGGWRIAHRNAERSFEAPHTARAPQ